MAALCEHTHSWPCMQLTGVFITLWQMPHRNVVGDSTNRSVS